MRRHHYLDGRTTWLAQPGILRELRTIREIVVLDCLCVHALEIACPFRLARLAATFIESCISTARARDEFCGG